MIRLHRVDLVDAFAEKLNVLTAIIEGQVAHDERVDEARRLWRTRHQIRAELKSYLHAFASGRSRCMYCGDNQGTDIDHYDPLARSPVRTFSWLNHLLACSACNSHHKGSKFPIATDGTPLLLDPTVDEPSMHLMLALSVGRYAPLTERGEATIEICQLNRDILCRGRQGAYSTITFILDAWSEAYEKGDSERANMVRTVILEQPFADVTAAMLHYVNSPGAEDLFRDRLHLVPILRHPALRSVLTNADN